MPPLAFTFVLILAGYLLGSLSGSLLLGRLRGVDIREQGSGNAGGTNALRAQGWKFALGVVAFDVFKGALAAWLALRYAPVGQALSVTAHGYAAGFAAVLGHVWPLWHGLRGGKGAAAAVGALLVLWPWAAPVLLLVWLGTIFASGYVGLATVVAALTLIPLAWLAEAGAPRWMFALGTAALLVFTHRGNLARLRAGTESRFENLRLMARLRRGARR